MKSTWRWKFRKTNGTMLLPSCSIGSTLPRCVRAVTAPSGHVPVGDPPQLHTPLVSNCSSPFLKNLFLSLFPHCRHHSQSHGSSNPAVTSDSFFPSLRKAPSSTLHALPLHSCSDCSNRGSCPFSADDGHDLPTGLPVPHHLSPGTHPAVYHEVIKSLR